MISSSLTTMKQRMWHHWVIRSVAWPYPWPDQFPGVARVLPHQQQAQLQKWLHSTWLTVLTVLANYIFIMQHSSLSCDNSLTFVLVVPNTAKACRGLETNSTLIPQYLLSFCLAWNSLRISPPKENWGLVLCWGSLDCSSNWSEVGSVPWQQSPTHCFINNPLPNPYTLL